ncbi:hypothetical protein CH333_01995 [candidate division WOR-3 bacterium JGI_Cruoil_03_44_89]|uniref:DUF5723 domain-containing protein n=1 Tax=candidate division WOR-3 bacterium JGI_Cruoil_03_44_89 TaxID=1973748 RepID=A0A235BXK6_UNCW3|nr:MAG: hypothetical protein CH333_01995 [candidate division WOR-3 bacterium JGI_Cruoil_03_44_89]
MIAPGTKAVAMGSAFTAIADDGTANYYNPGALPFHKNAILSTMNLSPPCLGRAMLNGYLYLTEPFFGKGDIPLDPPWIPSLYPGMRYSYVGGVSPINERDFLGVDYTCFTYGETEAIDPDGNPIIGKYKTYDLAVGVSYGVRPLRNLGIGVSLKYIYSYICPQSVIERIYGDDTDVRGYASSLAMDVGVLYKVPLLGLSFGATIKDVGLDLDWGLDSDPLPRRVRWGMGFDTSPLLDFWSEAAGFPIPLSSIINFEMCRDRLRDMVGDEHDTQYSEGYEIRLLNFSYRWGKWREGEDVWRRSNTKGYAINLGIIELGVSNDYISRENWRVQLNFTPFYHHYLNPIRNNEYLNTRATLLSSLVFPGGGQFWNGEELKGSGFLFSSLLLWGLYEIDNNLVPLVGFAIVDVYSIIDALRTTKTQRE